jgi:hypothetical protein
MDGTLKVNFLWSMQEGISNISQFAMAVKLVTLFWLWKSSLGKQLTGNGLVLLYYALCIFLVGTEEPISWRTRLYNNKYATRLVRASSVMMKNSHVKNTNT